VVDADLSKYSDAIPHDAPMQSIARRILDQEMLRLIKQWLKAPVGHLADDHAGAQVALGAIVRSRHVEWDDEHEQMPRALRGSTRHTR
jgi:hypothetical protein